MRSAPFTPMANDREPGVTDVRNDIVIIARDYVDARAVKRDLTDMMKELRIDSLGRTQESFERPRVPDGLVLPCAAYRLIADYLRCDPSFCNIAIPEFLPFGWVRLSFNMPLQMTIHGKEKKDINEDTVRIALTPG